MVDGAKFNSYDSGSYEVNLKKKMAAERKINVSL